jgi:peptidoglycan/LPS O-acetylase OafA/YrhL
MGDEIEILPTPELRQRDEYYPLFDWLRGLLAGVVMVSHQGLIPWEQAPNLAVQVFFALSGWLIAGMLLQMSRTDLPRFYFNRVARIWAPYYAALGILIAASVLRDPINSKWIEFVFYKSTFVYNLFGPPQLAAHRYDMPLDGTGNHFWSVNLEEQFYLLAPLLLVVISPKIGRALLTWTIVCLVSWLITVNVDIPITSVSICLGVIAALVVSKYGALHQGKIPRLIFACIMCGAGFGMAEGWSYNTLAPVFAITTVLLLAIKGRQNRFGALVGGISYPLYLNHWIGDFVAHATLKPMGLRDSFWWHPLSIALNLGIAYCMYSIVDRPVLRHRSQLFTTERGKIAMFAAYGILLLGLVGGIWFTYQRA